jgi:hypothetical protein
MGLGDFGSSGDLLQSEKTALPTTLKTSGKIVR